MIKEKALFANVSLACSVIAAGVLISFPYISGKLQFMRVSPSFFSFPLIQPVYFTIPLTGFLLGFISGRIARKLGGGKLVPDKKTDLSIVTARIGTAVVIMALAFSFFLRPLAGANAMARRAVCRNNIAGLVQMLHMYADEHDGRFPPSFKVLDEAGYEIGHLIGCPADDRGADYGNYGLNTAATTDSPPDTPPCG